MTAPRTVEVRHRRSRALFQVAHITDAGWSSRFEVRLQDGPRAEQGWCPLATTADAAEATAMAHITELLRSVDGWHPDAAPLLHLLDQGELF